MGLLEFLTNFDFTTAPRAMFGSYRDGRKHGDGVGRILNRNRHRPQCDRAIRAALWQARRRGYQEDTAPRGHRHVGMEHLRRSTVFSRPPGRDAPRYGRAETCRR